MSKIKCKYKFKNAEKFNGKAYCTCHNELCEDIAFCCDNNCQIYEDFKLLKRAEQKLEEIKDIVVPIKKNTCFGQYCGAIDWILQIIEDKENV